ncbi:hypothetical protein [Streptomyces sp. NPDC005004]
MPGSDISDGSGHSNASSYTSIRVSDGGRQVEDGRSAVPDDAPALFQGAEHGVYDERHRTYYAVDPDRRAVARWNAPQNRWDMETARRLVGGLVSWVAEHRGRIGQAVRDVAPTALQGASAFAPGTAGTALNVAGMAAQGATALNEFRTQYNQYRAGGHVDPVDVIASTGRLLSAGANAAGAGLGAESTLGTRLTGAGTYLAAAATATDIVHHAHTDDPRRRQDPANEMYGLHQNPRLGGGVGEVPPGWQPTPSVPSSSSAASVTTPAPQPPVAAPPAAHLPSGGSSGRQPAPSSGQGSSSGTTHRERQHHKKKNESKGKEVRRK